MGDVDCTSEGKPLCETAGVQGFPTIKWGSPDNLEDYKGGRDYEALKKFAKENLKPMCSPANIDLCDEEKKAKIEELQAMPAADLQAKIEEKKTEMKTLEETFESEVKKLQESYEQMQKDKEETIANVKKSGLGLMVAVQAAKKKELWIAFFEANFKY